MLRRSVIALVVFALTIAGSPFGPSRALAASPDIVISQVYGGGGNSGATLKNDFIELFNRGTSATDITGWSVQYASSAGSSWQKTNVSGVLQPGQYYLIQEAAGAGGTTNLPTADAVGAIPMSATAGKVALVTSQALLTCGNSTNNCFPNAAIRDFVGFGSANNYEDGAPVPTLSNTTAAVRVNAGCTDRDRNNLDFAVTAPNPRNTHTALAACPLDLAPTVAMTAPANNAANIAVDAGITITFSENVDVTGGWFAISCSSTGDHAASVTTNAAAVYTLDPAADFALDETCTVTVYASRVTDQDLLDPPDAMDANYVFSFSTLAPATAIHDIQGAAHTSPMNGALVKNATGIVTAKRTNGFYMQDSSADDDPATSEAIFVFTGSAAPVSVGDGVHVRGTVTEFRPGGAATNLSTTELRDVSVTGYSSGNALPTPVVISVDRTPPTQIIEDDATSGDVETSGVFDPATDGIDFWESLESMRVEIPEPLITSPSNKYNELGVVANGGAGATGITARGGIAIAADDRNPERILVDDEILKANGVTTFPAGINVGDHFAGSVTGVVDYDFGNFMLELTESPTLVRGGLAREVTAVAGPFDLTIATFNVENLDPGDHTFATMASLIVDNLRSPDLVSLEEIQDNNGETDTGIVDATTTLTMLRDAIVAAGGPTYAWSGIDPVNDMDGGAPGGNIRQVFFYRTDRGLAFVSRPGADSTTSNAVIDVSGQAQLQYSPGRIDPTNTAFTSSRKPLAGEFTYKGHRLFVVANHFNSKGGDDPLWGRHQPPVLSSEIQRMQQAAIVAGFVNDILAIEPHAEVVVLGDLNDFEFSAPLNTLKAAGLHDLIETLPVNERYTYVYEGNSQTLDHILVSDALLPVSTDDVVHVNAEFWDQASDHDPQVVRLLLPDPAGLCTITRAAVSGAGIANSLCAKLNAAKASLARGDRNAFAGQINAYVNEVSAQRGKAISTADADELTMLAGML